MSFALRYLHDGEKTRFNRYQTEDDENAKQEQDNIPTIFPKIGYLIGQKKKTKRNTLKIDEQLSSKANRYILFNTRDK